MPHRKTSRFTSLDRGLSVLFLLLVLPGLSMAFGFTDAIGNGTPLPCLAPRSLALGGAVSVGVDEAWAVFLNPARIPATGDETISAGAIYGGWRESVPVAGISLQKGEDISITPYAVFGMTVAANFAAAAGISTVSLFDYQGANLITDDVVNPYKVTETQFLDADGELSEALAGFSYAITDDLSLGLSGGLRFGSAHIIQTNYDYGLDSTVITVHDLSWEETQFCWHGGVKAGFGFGSAGLTYASPTDHYPARVALGGMVIAEHLNNTSVGFEVESFDPGSEAEYIARLMIEKPTASFLNTLVGVSFTDGPICDKPTLGFAVGFEMDFAPLLTQVAYSHRSRTRNSQYEGVQYYDYFDDSTTILSLALTYLL
jgi:hypothetical protein